MSVITSYPGVYIQELPNTSHSVTAAPTSITIFVGYTNPFWSGPPGAGSPPFGQAVQLLSFSDYQANFGGFFNWPWLPDYVGQAVYQFFLGGGAQAYVVALQAETFSDPAQSPPTIDIEPATALLAPLGSPLVDAFTFTALQPVGVDGLPNPGLLMSVQLSNITTGKPPSDPSPVAGDTADLTVVYTDASGTGTVEIYRRVLISNLAQTGPGAPINGVSALVTVAADTVPTSFAGFPTGQVPLTYTNPPTPAATIIDPSAFGAVFATNAPLDKVPIFNLMALPGMTEFATLAEALAYCERKRAFFIMDPPSNAVADELAESLLPATLAPAEPIDQLWNDGDTFPISPNGALYFPYLNITDPVTNQPANAPPSGFVAGVFAATDSSRGVWKSPAGLAATIRGASGVVPWGVLTDPQQGVLNVLGIDCIRSFPGTGTVVFGARTLVGQTSPIQNPLFDQWGYVAVRRMALFIEDSLYQSLGWAVFEPNAQPLWQALTQEVQAFMLGLFRQGAFAGSSASTSFLVQCDATTTTQADINQGIVNILVGFAPLKPAEFVIVQIQQLAGQTQS